MDATQQRILIVDDEENVVALFRRVLTKKGYAVQGASTAEEALAKLEMELFDLVVTDLKMPGMSGLELLRKGRQLAPSTPFVLLTAFGTVQTAVQAMKEGPMII